MCANERFSVYTVPLRYASMVTRTLQCVRMVVTEIGSEYGLKDVDVGIGEPPTGNQVERGLVHLHYY